MGDDSKPYFLGVFAIYLIVVSSLISFTIVNLDETSGEKALNINLHLPSMKNADFTNPEYQNILHIDASDSWEFDSEKGLYSTNPNGNTIYFQGLTASEGYYETTYTLKNPNGNYIEVILRDTSILSRSYIALYNDHVELWDKDGLLSGANLFYPVATYPVPYNQDSFTVTTYYNPDTGLAKFSINGNLIFSRTISTNTQTEVYLGLYTDGINTSIMGISSNTDIVDATSENWGIWEFLAVMATLLAYTVDDEYLPWWLNAVFIKVPILILIYIMIALIRGGS